MSDLNITLAQTFELGKKLLNESEIPDANLDAWYLMEHVFHVNKAQYYINADKKINETLYHKYLDLIKMRISKCPLQYIIGTQEFMGLDFIVNEHVLIPRQDTEILVEEVMKYATDKSVLDMCTGTSCIITSLAKLCNLKKALGVDVSEKALEIAHKNVAFHKVDVQLIHSDLFENITGKYDIIVSNPPYIPTKVIEGLMPEVKDHEPILALDGMEDGLYFYNKIIKQAETYLEEKGSIFFEIGHDQGSQVRDILEDCGFVDIEVIKDYAGLDRVVCAHGRHERLKIV